MAKMTKINKTNKINKIKNQNQNCKMKKNQNQKKIMKFNKLIILNQRKYKKKFAFELKLYIFIIQFFIAVYKYILLIKILKYFI